MKDYSGGLACLSLISASICLICVTCAELIEASAFHYSLDSVPSGTVGLSLTVATTDILSLRDRDGKRDCRTSNIECRFVIYDLGLKA